MHSIYCDNIAAAISLRHCSSETPSAGVNLNAAWRTANHVECSDGQWLPTHPRHISQKPGAATPLWISPAYRGVVCECNFPKSRVITRQPLISAPLSSDPDRPALECADRTGGASGSKGGLERRPTSSDRPGRVAVGGWQRYRRRRQERELRVIHYLVVLCRM